MARDTDEVARGSTPVALRTQYRSSVSPRGLIDVMIWCSQCLPADRVTYDQAGTVCL